MKSKFVAVVIVITVFLSSMVTAQTANLSDIKKQKSNVEKKLSDIAEKKKEEQKKLKSMVQNRNNLIKAQNKEMNDYKKLVEERDIIDKELNNIKSELRESEDYYKSQMNLFKTRIKVMYENLDYNYIKTIAESKSFLDFLTRLEIISTIAKSDKELLDTLEKSKKDLEYKKKVKDQQNSETKRKADTSLCNITQITSSRCSLENDIAIKKKKLEEIEREEDLMLEKCRELNDSIRRLQSNNTKYTGGKMLWPVPASHQISSYYGTRKHPILNTYRFHSGLDIPADYGQSIVAANRGRVIISGWQGGYGYTVAIDHGGGIVSLYGHCSKLLVNIGDYVDAGQTIAKIGSTGLSTGPHTHFEIRKSGGTVDPLEYVVC